MLFQNTKTYIILLIFLQIKWIRFVTKMDTYIYVHHQGQYRNPDSKSKVSLKTKQMNFMEIFYDLTHSLPMKLEGNKLNCNEYKKDYSLDYCMTDVSNRFVSGNIFGIVSYILFNFY